MALDSNLALQQKQRERTKLLPFSFVTKYYPAVPNLKQVFMNNWINPGMQSKQKLRRLKFSSGNSSR